MLIAMSEISPSDINGGRTDMKRIRTFLRLARCSQEHDLFFPTPPPMNRKGWGNLCRLLSRGNLRAEKGACILEE